MIGVQRDDQETCEFITFSLDWGHVQYFAHCWTGVPRTYVNNAIFLRIEKRNKTASSDEIIPVTNCISLYDISHRQNKTTD